MKTDLLRRITRLQTKIHDEANYWPENERGRLAEELRRIADAVDRRDPTQDTFGFARQTLREDRQ